VIEIETIEGSLEEADLNLLIFVIIVVNKDIGKFDFL
jgi:hypothetical protein